MKKRTRVLVSACLLGCPVRYDGQGKADLLSRLEELQTVVDWVSFCPEVEGGLSVPRPAAEIVGAGGGEAVLSGRAVVRTREGADVTAAFVSGARRCLALAQREGVRFALLKARSPSCGSAEIYDGSFHQTLTDGAGVTTALLRQNGIEVFEEGQIAELLAALRR